MQVELNIHVMRTVWRTFGDPFIIIYGVVPRLCHVIGSCLFINESEPGIVVRVVDNYNVLITDIVYEVDKKFLQLVGKQCL